MRIGETAHHDLEVFPWVLVYAIMIHHYNSLTCDTDRTEYKETLDEYSGHGGSKLIVKNRQAVYLPHSCVSEDGSQILTSSSSSIASPRLPSKTLKRRRRMLGPSTVILVQYSVKTNTESQTRPPIHRSQDQDWLGSETRCHRLKQCHL